MILFKIKTRMKVLCSFALAAILLIPSLQQVSAQSIGELRQRSEQLEAEISANEGQITELSRQVDTLQGKISQLNLEITQAQKEIELTEVKLDELLQRLNEAEAELQRQRELLRISLRALYKTTNTSTLELLITSESFSDFIGYQESLDRIQASVKTSVDRVIALKQQIEEEKRLQEELLARQEEQKSVLAAKREEQQVLLEQTQGEEQRYRDIVAAQQAELQDAEEQLAALLSAGSFVSLGPVRRGEVIGKVGSTGFSTGPHIHFQVYKDGVTQNPYLGGTTLVNGYMWPTPGNYIVTTLYGWIPCQDYVGCSPPGASYSVWHSGLDIRADAYDPIVAAADGEVVFKGCRGGLGYVVVVDHGGGWQTWYPHQVTPDGQVYGRC